MFASTQLLDHRTGGLALLFVAGSLCLPGCGGGGDHQPTAPVSGIIKYQGEPLNGGSVIFVPTEGGPTATGNIGPGGEYTLKTYVAGDGAVLGKHGVMVVSTDGAESQGLAEDVRPKNQNAAPGASGKTRIPIKYGSDATSGLTATVKEDGNEIDFDLD